MTDQPQPSVLRLRDAAGRLHYAAPASPFVVAGLADGSLVDVDAPPPQEEMVADATADAADGDAADTGQPGR